jgi:hypothetical protein
MKKWYWCDNKLGASLQIGAYKYLKVPYGKNFLDEKLVKGFGDILKEIVEEKKVVLVEAPVETSIDIVEEEIHKKKKRGRPKKK